MGKNPSIPTCIGNRVPTQAKQIVDKVLESSQDNIKNKCRNKINADVTSIAGITKQTNGTRSHCTTCWNQ